MRVAEGGAPTWSMCAESDPDVLRRVLIALRRP